MTSYQPRHSSAAPSARTSTKVKAVAAVGIAGIVTLLGMSSSATAASGLSGLELAQVTKGNCQILQAHATSTAQRNRAIQCIADANVVISALTSPSTSPSASPTASASPSPTMSPSPTVSPSPTATSSPSPSPSPSPTVTPSPSPSPSSSGSKPTNCFTQLAACGYPTINSTGVSAGTFLTPVSGNVVLSTAGQVYEGKDVHGCIDVIGANVTIRNVRVTGPCFYGISTDNAATGTTTITHVEVNCTDGFGTAINGPHFVATFVYLHDCENGLEINEGSSISDSYLVAREGSTDGHGDDIQSQGGNNITIRHNTFAGLNPITSSIITNPTANNNWTVTDNFMSAGAYTFYCPEQGTGFTVQNNRFYPVFAANGTTHLYPPDAHAPAYGFTDACDHAGINWSGNYLDSNLTTVGP